MPIPTDKFDRLYYAEHSRLFVIAILNLTVRGLEPRTFGIVLGAFNHCTTEGTRNNVEESYNYREGRHFLRNEFL